MEETLERIEVRAEIEEVKKLGGDKDKEREVVWVRLNEMQRRKVLEMKKKLRGKKERILED